MSFYHNPKIITDGLILYYDSINFKSYPKTGSIWYNLSNLDVNAELKHNISFNGSSFVYDGLGDYVNIPYSFTIGDGNEHTVSLVTEFYKDEDKTLFESGGIEKLFIIHYSSSYQHSFLSRVWDGVNPVVKGIGVANIDKYNQYNKPYFVDVTLTTNLMTLYIDGEKIGSTQFDIMNIMNSSYMRLGGITNNWYYEGAIYSYKYYNRALSDDEIKQNYIALRGRYIKKTINTGGGSPESYEYNPTPGNIG